MSIKKWINEYSTFNQDEKMKAAQAIINGLDDRPRYYPFDDEDNNEVVVFFRKLLNSANRENAIKEGSLLNKFQGLSQKNKEKAVDDIVSILKQAIAKDSKEKRENICLNEGHQFGKWKLQKRYGSSAVFDGGVQGYVDVEWKEWNRTCGRCGLVETVEVEPDEVRAERMEKEKQDKIKKYKMEINKLQGKNVKEDSDDIL